MASLNRRKTLKSGVVLSIIAGCFVIGASHVALANGDAFFDGQEVLGETEFVFFGGVKDEDGNYLGAATVTVDVLEPLLTYENATDILGRYRSADVGRVMIELGYPVDPSKIVVTVSKEGYTQTRRLKRSSPRTSKGAFEMDFVMAKNKDKADTAKK